MATTNHSRTAKKIDVRKMTIIGMLSAISIIMANTPIGYVPINPMVNLTIMHIPVIIGAIMEGPLAGAFVGLIFGLTSMARAFIAPTVTNFVFMNPMVSVIPRVLIGVISYYAYVLAEKIVINIATKLGKQDSKNKKLKTIPAAITGVTGTLVNTGGVLVMIYVLYAQRFAEAFISNDPNAINFSPAYIIFGMVGANAIAEAILAAVIVGVVTTALKVVRK
ncbi:MAG: ECF transporter S component, partial [Paraclostridium sp.]